MTEYKNINQYVHTLGVTAVAAAKAIAQTDSAAKNQALLSIAQSLEQNNEKIIAANAKDMAQGKSNNLSSALLDRLELNPARINGMIENCHQVAQLDDPVGQMTDFVQQPSGIKIAKMRVPLGVIGIIYESRPNVTIEAAALCLKAGNAAILRGGSEAIHSNLLIAQCIDDGLKKTNVDSRCIQVVNTVNRDAVGVMITLSDYIDVIIPRGGKNLIERISAEATIPVIKHLDGLCHVYIDDDADIEKALAIAYNAKARRYGVCGAMETLLVAQSVAEKILPDLCHQYQQKGIELRGCEKTRKIVPAIQPATEQDWQTEYLDAKLSICVVDGIDQAMAHIDQYGSHHTDSIISENKAHQQLFIRQVDSSSVMVNTSTQFADGFEYGLGAEIGISTGKLHVRGPVGLEGLTTQKYVVVSDGQVRL